MTAQWYAVGIGSNLGDRLGHLRLAVQWLSGHCDIIAVSSVYESAPVGYLEQGDFLNAVVLVRAALAPPDLLSLVEELEGRGGRVREIPGGPRTLDLDLILWEGGIVREPGLRIPHPSWKERAFVLAPLSEVAPHLPDPVSGKTVGEIWDEEKGRLEPVDRITGNDWFASPVTAAREEQG